MERRLTELDRDALPVSLHPLLDGARVFDSSSSPAAKVWFLDKDGGYYLKAAAKGSLQREAELTHFFHRKGLAAQVLHYESGDQDWLLTARVSGEDCVFPAYLADPKRLCDTTAEILRMLHGADPSDCPVSNRTAEYLSAAAANARAGRCDLHLFSENWSRWRFSSAQEAWRTVEENAASLTADTLLHGDYCLPNILLNDWKFSGFVDLDTGGVGDRHVDLFWATWSLEFNLKTDAYRDRFLDAYGREAVEEEKFRLIAAVEMFG